MPCRCDYMEPNEREQESRRVAKLLVFAQKSLGIQVDAALVLATNNEYGNVRMVDEWTKQLCELCANMTDGQLNEVHYDGKENRFYRPLADWWKNHQERDKAREAEEQRLALVRSHAIMKLTPEERKALEI